MSIVSEFITDVMTLTGLGLFFDQVLIGKDERQKISRYLEANSEPSTLTDKYLQFLALSHTVVFGRFFSGKLLSWSFFSSALAVSLVSFTLVAAIQIYLDPAAISGVQFDTKQYLVIGAFLAFNVVFDYFTIVQTKIFIEASLAARSIFRSVVFIASDLLVTMNTFVLSYAAFVLLVVQFFVAPEVSMIFLREKNRTGELASTESQPDFLLEIGANDLAKRMAFEGNFRAIVAADKSAQEYERLVVYYHSTFQPDPAEIQTFLVRAFSKLNVDFPSGFSEINEESDKELLELASRELRADIGFRMPLEGEDEEQRTFEKTEILVDGSVLKTGSLNAAYTATFSRTDFLEDGFPASLLNLEIVPLSRFVSETAAAELGAFPKAICFLENGATVRISLSAQNKYDFSVCEDVIAVDFLWHWGLSRDLGPLGRGLSERIAPYNTLLITSLLPTFLFYMAIVLMAVTTLVYSVALSHTNRFKRIFLRAPMATAGFVVAIPMSVLGWL
ncbi:hypothetical protein [Ruegeria atlantica]|uniref:Uncharacterized protein n=1 Tax=Ruegeria atlantica TaxID=81569 RepID=A0ABX1WDW6_9RHOB|nr:hypothetical protein [Ruegeria atlantica]NOD31485.1 hypothetical protein [Ruegeria atlantica]